MSILNRISGVIIALLVLAVGYGVVMATGMSAIELLSRPANRRFYFDWLMADPIKAVLLVIGWIFLIYAVTSGRNWRFKRIASFLLPPILIPIAAALVPTSGEQEYEKFANDVLGFGVAPSILIVFVALLILTTIHVWRSPTFGPVNRFATALLTGALAFFAAWHLAGGLIQIAAHYSIIQPSAYFRTTTVLPWAAGLVAIVVAFLVFTDRRDAVQVDYLRFARRQQAED